MILSFMTIKIVLKLRSGLGSRYLFRRDSDKIRLSITFKHNETMRSYLSYIHLLSFVSHIPYLFIFILNISIS